MPSRASGMVSSSNTRKYQNIACLLARAMCPSSVIIQLTMYLAVSSYLSGSVQILNWPLDGFPAICISQWSDPWSARPPEALREDVLTQEFVWWKLDLNSFTVGFCHATTAEAASIIDEGQLSEKSTKMCQLFIPHYDCSFSEVC